MLMFFYRFKVGMASLVFELQVTQHRGESLVVDPEAEIVVFMEVIRATPRKKWPNFIGVYNFFFDPDKRSLIEVLLVLW